MRYAKWLLIVIGVAVAATLLYQIPAINRRLYWRLDAAQSYLRGLINPVSAPPTPGDEPRGPSASPTLPPPQVIVATFPPTAIPSPEPSPSPIVIPQAISLHRPEWEQQDWNNCGPAALSMYLRYYGWEGDQYAISDQVKPERSDRNVNPDELVYYTRVYAGWLRSTYRVGGEMGQLKALIAAGVPVIVETVFRFEEEYWPNDDLWAAHYLLLTGYNDLNGTFTAHDTFYGPDQLIPYDQFDADWQAFNRVYLLVYLPEQGETIQAILGDDWDVDANRQAALETAEQESQTDPENAFAWFNLGTNLSYFERYAEAAQAYKTALALGLPQRMLRYQFGPFLAYFRSRRTADLLALTEYALTITPNSEEALLWRGWGLWLDGDTQGAIDHFRQAYEANPTYSDAQYALDFMGVTP